MFLKTPEGELINTRYVIKIEVYQGRKEWFVRAIMEGIAPQILYKGTRKDCKTIISNYQIIIHHKTGEK